MPIEKGDLQHTDKGKVVGKQQLYALLVNDAGLPILDAGGNTQVIEVTAGTDGKIKAVVAGEVGIDPDHNAVVVAGSYQEVDVTIANEGTESTEIDFRNFKYLSFLMPSEWDAATITIKGSAVSGGTKVDIVNDAGVTFPAMTVAVNKIYVVDVHALKLAGVHYLALVASAAQTPARTIKVMLKA